MSFRSNKREKKRVRRVLVLFLSMTVPLKLQAYFQHANNRALGLGLGLPVLDLILKLVLEQELFVSVVRLDVLALDCQVSLLVEPRT